MIWKVLGAIAGVLILALVIINFTADDTFTVERSIVVNAPPAKVFPLVNTLAFWVAWSPYEKDPKMKRTLGGPPSGVGSFYEWDGNNDVGAGRNEIIKSEPNSLIEFKLDFVRPFEGHNKVEFRFVPDGAGVKVTWFMTGASSIIMKVAGLFIDCDKMIGGDFGKGLEKLKAIAERG